MRQPIGVQVTWADWRLKDAAEMGMNRPRVPEAEWPAGERWCAGCQGFVPIFYVQGSRCRACNSRATHATHIKRTYDLDPAEYDRLLEWQGGACFICGQTPRSRRLAVDHDHESGVVRGLLCANDEFGCNVQLRRLLNDIAVARRALEYVELNPLQRMRQGEAPRARPRRRDPLRESLQRRPEARWDPFAA